MSEITRFLENLFKKWSGITPVYSEKLSPSGSNRKYFRIAAESISVIGTFNENVEENQAFFYLTGHFRKQQLPVPEIYVIDDSGKFYLQEDLGDTTLFELISKSMNDGSLNDKVVKLINQSIETLPSFQIMASKGLNFSHCYPVKAFDKQSISWDLNYFKYFFARLLDIPFNEKRLDNDFHSLIRFLTEKPFKYFMYRDFQSRNIMIVNDKPYFIDYQGGRKGPIQYDVVSFLFQIKAGFSEADQDKFLKRYLNSISQFEAISKAEFLKYLPAFILLRYMQVLGAYGYRGIIERKSHFLESLPLAINKFRSGIHKLNIPVHLPEIINIFEHLPITSQKKPDELTVIVNSFSYKQGVPLDDSGHGGGFVFDCRSLPNPGREEHLSRFTGKDQPIITYLAEKRETSVFLSHVFCLLDKAIENYLSRGFTNLQVNFGCTGGKHRSVYCAEKTAWHIKQKFSVIVKLNHREIES
ncbi:MAG: phosphotransferase [Bacteroidetes bacterium]|nr:phosphotransferase [Bacteroidota bacterium]